MSVTLKFKTNINCGGCQAKVTPFLNEEKRISSWKVDLNDPDRVLSVETESLSARDVIETVAKAGFKADEL